MCISFCPMRDEMVLNVMEEMLDYSKHIKYQNSRSAYSTIHIYCDLRYTMDQKYDNFVEEFTSCLLTNCISQEIKEIHK